MPDYRPAARFLGLEDAHSTPDSAAWLLPIPYEMTTSYSGGTKLGAAAILEASAQVELYDAAVGCEAAPLYGVHTLPFLHPTLESPAAAAAEITEAVSVLNTRDHLLITLGGEHAITPAVVHALAAYTPDLIVVQLDAHADLRDSFDGTPHSHACAMRRCLDSAAVSGVIGLGIRSLCQEEADFAATSDRVTLITAEQMHHDTARRYLDRLREQISGRSVYLTIDVDGLDPSVISATGTPEPGGMGWYDCLALIGVVCSSAQVVAFDCVELAPTYGDHASTFAAAKLVYKTLNQIMLARGKLGTVR
ncbi:MAG: agmatinase [Chloroflexi bacterium CFX4]|nr:agmatinase [Chloroflexi bacterium CFX4]MDL1923712.1 agmatinase [Chloroflexi bacterium CFX3]